MCPGYYSTAGTPVPPPVTEWYRSGVVMVTVSMMVPPGLAMREQQPTEQQGAFKTSPPLPQPPSPQWPPPPRYASRVEQHRHRACLSEVLKQQVQSASDSDQGLDAAGAYDLAWNIVKHECGDDWITARGSGTQSRMTADQGEADEFAAGDAWSVVW